MAKVAEFNKDKISDQKRLVRGLHSEFIMSVLRCRDEVHHRNWKILILPGKDPTEEINCLRHLMHRCEIVAVDRDEECLINALDAGANEAIHTSLDDFHVVYSGARGNYKGNKRVFPPIEIYNHGRYDAVVLDLCSNLNKATAKLFRVYYAEALKNKGAMVFNFLSGRDVMEAITMQARANKDEWERLMDSGMPANIAYRILYLVGNSRQRLGCVRSVLSYTGKNSPMISVAFRKSSSYWPEDLSYERVGPGDFEIAVTCPDPALVYACPAERIKKLRQQNAAIKAHHTMKKNAKRKRAEPSFHSEAAGEARLI